MTRAKFYCQSVTDFGNDNQTVVFQAHTAKGTDEDKHFSKYTPSGKLEISVTNPDLIGKFKPLKNYWLDISECAD